MVDFQAVTCSTTAPTVAASGEIARLHAMGNLLDHLSAAQTLASSSAETARTRYAIGTVAERHIALFKRLLGTSVP